MFDGMRRHRELAMASAILAITALSNVDRYFETYGWLIVLALLGASVWVLGDWLVIGWSHARRWFDAVLSVGRRDA